jgi:hypothetical protein
MNPLIPGRVFYLNGQPFGSAQGNWQSAKKRILGFAYYLLPIAN